MVVLNLRSLKIKSVDSFTYLVHIDHTLQANLKPLLKEDLVVRKEINVAAISLTVYKS